VASASGPSASLTFLFTDLANSTKLWEERPGDMTEALVEHNTILGETIARNGGVIVKTGGDGLMAVFGDPDHAGRRARGPVADLLPMHGGDDLHQPR
jgi:class 3 adenylate cyclase